MATRWRRPCSRVTVGCGFAVLGCSASPKEAVPPIDDVVSQYFVRLNVVDKPGVLARIAEIFGASNIGISSVIQPEGHEGESVPLIFMLHYAANGAVTKALVRIGRLPVVKGKPVMIRVEDFE